ncbi:MAG: aminopeptidase N C-terminal domain-containing protein, partial [Alphaproteobacteria bacterium]|nr:aminopeptidase N C-terminal domain-containing protein [Alphaproteobacteria bacterium]
THATLAKSVKETDDDGIARGKRGLKNLCLSYLSALDDAKTFKSVFAQATKSKNMTDQIAALAMLAESKSPLRARAFKAFEKKWIKTPTIMDKWLAVQAGAKRPDTLKTVRALLKHPAFTLKNPNRISALIGVFAANIAGFHAKDGSGYRFVADMILQIDPLNPHSAAGLAKNFARWRDYDAARQKKMKAELKRLAAHRKLSPNTMEVVGRSLKA